MRSSFQITRKVGRVLSGLCLLLASPTLADDHALRASPEPSERFLENAWPSSFRTFSAASITIPTSYALSIEGDFELGGFVFRDGYAFIHTDAPSTLSTAVGRDALVSTTPGVPDAYNGTNNTAFGAYALQFTTEGYFNTASGYAALKDNTEGARNTAIGHIALVSNTMGSDNTAAGTSALSLNETGSFNTATGASSLMTNVDGGQNSAFGWSALYANMSGSGNTAIGDASMSGNTTGANNTAVGGSTMTKNDTGADNTALGGGALNGNIAGSRNTAVGVSALLATTVSDNIALGHSAGKNATTGSQNIFIGNEGAAADANTIKIGNANHSKTFIDGILGVTLPMSGTTVFIDNNNQLGTMTSSRRFKEGIADMGSASNGIGDLRPVTFRYTEEVVSDGPRPTQFGLIAEEVAEVLPDLVVYDAEGRPYSVKYHLLAPMLLNEIQRLSKRVVELERMHTGPSR